MIPAVIKFILSVAQQRQHVAVRQLAKKTDSNDTMAVKSAAFPWLQPWATRCERLLAIQFAHAHSHQQMFVREIL